MLARVLMPVGAACALAACSSPPAAMPDDALVFHPAHFQKQEVTVNDQTIAVRAWENVVYVRQPVDAKYQAMNIYVPEAYFQGASVGGYTAAHGLEPDMFVLGKAIAGGIPAAVFGLSEAMARRVWNELPPLPPTARQSAHAEPRSARHRLAERDHSPKYRLRAAPG